jgi:hypothetical protein
MSILVLNFGFDSFHLGLHVDNSVNFLVSIAIQNIVKDFADG